MYSHKRVLVALDGSEAGTAVMKLLMEIAGPLDMTIMLVHVVEPIRPQAVEGTVIIDDITVRRRDAEEYLAPISAMLRSQGVDTSWAIRYGQPADEILAAAKESGVDLIAMGTHGRTGLGRLLFGSVAETVLRRTTVPVFLMRQPHTVETASPAQEERMR